MEPKIKIKVTDVSKRYKLYKRNFEKIVDVIPFSKVSAPNFYALRNISFEVYEGETVGIVGINGSGKSTLSNILAQVIPTTTGELDIRGETSLIAISVGLDKNLTGLDNIEQKCLMHGLKTDEIKALTPSIIEFADIGDFIEQPVKNYSSGMKARLGFAISIHTNPDILIIDEALSVGDQTFYQKCLDKINDFKKSGKTIFFVSHSISQVRSISDRAMWIHYGEMQEFGEVESVLGKYGDFIKWYRGLSKEEQKEYKNKMNGKQRQELVEHGDIENAAPRQLKIKNKKGKNNQFLLFQILLLFCFTLLSVWLLFKGKPPFSLDIGRRLHAQTSAVEHNNESPKRETVNREGNVIAGTASLFSNDDLTDEIGRIPFSTTVYVVEKIDHLYKVNYDNLVGYTESSNIDFIDQGNLASQYRMKDVLPILPPVFGDSYQFFLAHLSLSYPEVKESLRGLTEESTDVYGNRTLVYQYENVSFIENKAGIVDSLIIHNIDVENELMDSIRKEALITSTNHDLMSLKISNYQAIVNVNEQTIQLTIDK